MPTVPEHRPLVDYLIARDGPPTRSGLAYDYILARDGVFIATENAMLVVRLPVASCRVRGDRIVPVGGNCTLRHGRLPRAVWDACLAHARDQAARQREVTVLVTFRRDGPAGERYGVIRPAQTVTPTRSTYDEPVLSPGETVLLSFHSHHAMRAYFSPADDGDEQQLRLYAVVGRLDMPQPEVALRAGFNGHWLPLPWEAVFAGNRGPFRDTSFDAPDEATAIDECRELPAPAPLLLACPGLAGPLSPFLGHRTELERGGRDDC